MLTFANLKADLCRFAGVNSTTVRPDILQAVKTAISRGIGEFVTYGDWSFINQFQGQVYIPIQTVYTTGTVTATNLSQTIAGVGTSWTSALVGQYFKLDNQETYEIQSVASATSLTLTIPFQGATAATQTYSIQKRFYPLPLNYLRPLPDTAKAQQVGSGNEIGISYRRGTAFSDLVQTNQPYWFAIEGNTRGTDYYNTGTVTISTSGTTSTWTISSGTLPTDIVGLEIRIAGESQGYVIATRGGATTLTTLAVYVNPTDGTNTQATASTYAVTPKETQMIAIGDGTDGTIGWIFNMAYIKRIPDLVADTDVSPVSQFGYDDELLAICRWKFVEDFRDMVRSQFDASAIIQAGKDALFGAWANEQAGRTAQAMSEGFVRPVRVLGPSWIG